MIISLAGHELQSIDDIYINDEIVALDGNGLVTSAPWNNKIRIQKFLGNQITAPASLLAESTQVNANFIGRGIAYLYIRMEYDQDVFANGIPLFTAKVKGKKVFDPRTSTIAYSANAALCIRDYLVTDYGMADVGSTDDTVFSVAANVCDEVVTLDGGGTEPRYEMNGVISAALAPGDILQSMMTSCAGTLFWGQGKWQLKPGYYSAPAKTFTLDDLRGPISLSTRTSRRDNFNIVRGKFNSADARWITADYPELRSAPFIAEDGGLENALDIEFPLTTSAAMVQRLAKLTLFRGREQMAFSADFSMAAFNVQVGDIIALTNPRYGWGEEEVTAGSLVVGETYEIASLGTSDFTFVGASSNEVGVIFVSTGIGSGTGVVRKVKEFEVLGWRFFADGDAGDLRVNLSLRETSSAAFDWDAEESAITNNQTSLPNLYAGLAIDNLGAFQSGRVQGDGTFVNTIVCEWDAAENSFVSHYEVEWKSSIDANYFSTVTPQNSIEVSPIVDGLSYTFRVRAVNGVSGNRGAYSDVTLVAGGDTSIPSVPNSLEAYAGYRYIGLNWVAPTTNTDTTNLKDLLGYKVYRNTTNDFSTSVMVVRTGATSYTDTGLSDLSTLFYWVTAVDFSGNESSNSAPASATTLVAPDGARGAGRWNVSVTSLPTTSAEADAAFVADVGSPVDRDQGWFYTGTESAPTGQSVWIYNFSSDLWTEQTEVIDGDLLVDGTITADKLIAQSISALGLTIGSLSDNPTGERIVFSDSKIEVFDSTNTLRVVIGDLS
jgi:hypothetical protein